MLNDHIDIITQNPASLTNPPMLPPPRDNTGHRAWRCNKATPLACVVAVVSVYLETGN